ncbi:unnamed protein product, partial [Rotaria sordida]
YQRVFARKLYINEDIIDLHDLSDDENNDTDSKRGSGQLHRRFNVKETEDSNARTKSNSAFEKDDQHVIPTITISPTPDIEVINENSMNRHNSGFHFIIGYAGNEKHEKSRGLLETISSVVAQTQTSGDNIELSIISDEKQPSNPYGVKFCVSFSSDEDTDDDDDGDDDDDDNDDDDDDDDDEELTEIVTDHGNRGNIFKKMPCPPSPKNKTQFDDVKKLV